MHPDTYAVPHLTTAMRGALLELETLFLSRQAHIEAWFRRAWLVTPPPFYCSVDLRNSGFKIAPVDTNLFPAGFNNLNRAFMPLCVQAAQAAIQRVCAKALNILIVPESHTRNIFYLESLATLKEILIRAGFVVRIGSLLTDMREPLTIDLPSGRRIILEELMRDGERVSVADFEPCMVLLNHDMSGGRPAILENLDQPVVPPLNVGWSNRLKSEHFAQYRSVASEFAQLLNIDPWMVDPLFRHCGEIDFMKREGEDCVARNVQALLTEIQAKYNTYGVDKTPFVIVKADAGTYGMGIMTVRNADEIYELNRKQRTRMTATKGGQVISKVIVQEGVYTFETWNDAVAEPVVYMMDHNVVGGFYRVHKERGVDENLNAPGMHFEPLAFANPGNCPDPTQDPDADPNRFYVYGVVARLALLAAAREIAEATKK
ncbi:MAG: glutamate--cysteine ligase [Pseudomonadota bacterium]